MDFSNKNGLVLNVDKCAVMTFTKRTSTAISFNYNIANKTLKRNDSIRDLGVQIDKKLNYAKHIETICRKGKQMVGFIIRNSKHFKKKETEILLYKSLARSHLEYASEIWSSAAESNLESIEKVQHRFIRYLARKYYNDHCHHIDYEKYEKITKIDPLHQRRLIKDVNFTIKSFTGDIDSSSYLHLFNLHAPHRNLRERTTFRPSSSNTVTNRLMRGFNEHINDYDVLTSKFAKWRTIHLFNENR